MLIRKVVISPKIKFKVHNKHGIDFKEINQSLLSENRFFKKTKDGKYIAFTKYKRYLTIVFSIESEIAEIITAYPSSEWQVKLFKRRKK